jgi:hypothetical protein
MIWRDNMVEHKENIKEIKVCTIHSQKGGVGKTSVALAKAGWSAFKGSKKTLILDADVTGTSLFDLFEVKAECHFLNELLLADPRFLRQYQDHPKELEASFCVPITSCPNIYFMPSSPILEDIRIIVSLISQEDKLHFFQSRIKDILGMVLKNNFETIIIDTPPGLYGISKAMLEMRFKDTTELKFSEQAIFLTSSDKVDYRALFLSLAKTYQGVCVDERKLFSVLFNKFPTSAFREHAFKLKEIYEDLQSLLKRYGANQDVLEKIKSTASFAGDFDMEQIMSSIKKLSAQSGHSDSCGPFEKWCLSMDE